MEIRTLNLKRRPNFKEMNEVLEFQSAEDGVKIAFHHKDTGSEISIEAPAEYADKITDFLTSRDFC